MAVWWTVSLSAAFFPMPLLSSFLFSCQSPGPPFVAPFRSFPFFFSFCLNQCFQNPGLPQSVWSHVFSFLLFGLLISAHDPPSSRLPLLGMPPSSSFPSP